MEPQKTDAIRKINAAIISIISLALFLWAASYRILVNENFEGGSLDSRLSITKVGTFNIEPGIQPIAIFGSKKAYGFGVSKCPSNCWDAHVSSLTISFPQQKLIDSISFKEMELGGNWGSVGTILVDDKLEYDAQKGFGRPIHNDDKADKIFRQRDFAINKPLSKIQLRVADITKSSQIVIDDLKVHGTPQSLLYLALCGLALLIVAVALFFIRKSYANFLINKRNRSPKISGLAGWCLFGGLQFGTSLGLAALINFEYMTLRMIGSIAGLSVLCFVLCFLLSRTKPAQVA